MSIFNFRRKQRLNAELYGHTSGKEMFQVDEYNQKKRITVGIIIWNVLIFTLSFFYFDLIQNKIGLYLLIITFVSWVLFYFNFKSQKRLRENLYA